MSDLTAERSPDASAIRRRSGRSRQQVLLSQDRWLVSYADFMTLLFALFVVLFATSHHNPAAFGRLSGSIQQGFGGRKPSFSKLTIESPQAAAPRESALEAELRTALDLPVRRREISLQQTADGLVLSFQEFGFFRSGEANILPGQSALILQAAAILKRHGAHLRVEGHSDDQPIHTAEFASNWELSAARAMTVLLLLVNDAHYDPTALSMAGYGPYRPVGDNLTMEGRQKNRGVDLVVASEEEGPVAPIQDKTVAARIPDP